MFEIHLTNFIFKSVIIIASRLKSRWLEKGNLLILKVIQAVFVWTICFAALIGRLLNKWRWQLDRWGWLSMYKRHSRSKSTQCLVSTTVATAVLVSTAAVMLVHWIGDVVGFLLLFAIIHHQNVALLLRRFKQQLGPTSVIAAHDDGVFLVPGQSGSEHGQQGEHGQAQNKQFQVLHFEYSWWSLCCRMFATNETMLFDDGTSDLIASWLRAPVYILLPFARSCTCPEWCAKWWWSHLAALVLVQCSLQHLAIAILSGPISPNEAWTCYIICQHCTCTNHPHWPNRSLSKQLELIRFDWVISLVSGPLWPLQYRERT